MGHFIKGKWHPARHHIRRCPGSHPSWYIVCSDTEDDYPPLISKEGLYCRGCGAFVGPEIELIYARRDPNAGFNWLLKSYEWLERWMLTREERDNTVEYHKNVIKKEMRANKDV
jgi:hypothetical protein